MSQPPDSGPGTGAQPGPDPGLPGGPDLRPADFAQGGAGDTCPPGPALAAALAGLSGPDGRCPGASDDELAGLLRGWAAVEAWAAAGKLGVVRELIRRRARPGPGHGDLPDAWEEGLAHELAPALGASLPGADKLANTAWELGARLPGTGAALAAGVIDYVKATIIVKELSALDDAHAAQAEAMLLPAVAGKTPGQLARLAADAVIAVDPDGARKRREAAERDEARVRCWREHTGAAALAGYGLPADAALAASAGINQRAQEYKQAKVMPGAGMDRLRVLAFCDILNGITAADRIARARAEAGAQEPAAPGSGDRENTPAGSGPGDAPGGPALPARANLTLPLATLLGMAERPGHAHGLGPLDPALARGLAAAAARSPHSTWCVTITDASGYAVGHGCARAARTARTPGKPSPPGSRAGPWRLTRADDPGPPGGYGTWTLTLPDGRGLTVRLGPVPLTGCDHRHESPGYQPGNTLRHLVQIRDGECTFPSCSRHARETDFEHAIPYDQGGRTCACNAGARSRRCHQVKQSRGWSVTQPRPGWHRWRTPGGRTYTQGPAKYPA